MSECYKSGSIAIVVGLLRRKNATVKQCKTPS